MQQVTRCHVPASAQNALRIVSGAWLFDQADYVGILFLNDLFVNDLPFGLDMVTASSNVNFRNGLRPSGTVVGYAKIKQITRAKVVLYVELRANEYKTREERTVLDGEFTFTLVNRDTLKISPIPKEIVEKYKKDY